MQLGNNNTYYAIFFPHGKFITVQGGSGHYVMVNSALITARSRTFSGFGEVYYGVHPDFQAGLWVCKFGCGAATTVFGNYTQVASHDID